MTGLLPKWCRHYTKHYMLNIFPFDPIDHKFTALERSIQAIATYKRQYTTPTKAWQVLFYC
jgi:hypothetical protein